MQESREFSEEHKQNMKRLEEIAKRAAPKKKSTVTVWDSLKSWWTGAYKTGKTSSNDSESQSNASRSSQKGKVLLIKDPKNSRDSEETEPMKNGSLEEEIVTLTKQVERMEALKQQAALELHLTQKQLHKEEAKRKVYEDYFNQAL